MSRRVVIADAGPLIALVRVDALGLLPGLFGRIYITQAVRAEILPAGAPFADAALLTRALREGWLETVDMPMDGWRPLNPGVDAGEASAIRAACRWRGEGSQVLLIMDDRAGRLEAKSHGIPLIGTAALIGLAKTQGLIPAAKPLLERLARSGYFLGHAVLSAVLADVGESWNGGE
jgi:predicted nucleic acid-binding protein